MRTLIIGGTRGLGAGIAVEMNILKDEVSYVTGHEIDINNPHSQEQLFDMMHSFDIIINNAYSGMAQRDILFGAFELFKDTNKIFVNIESINAWREGQLNEAQIEYATNKLALVAARRHLQKLPRKMSIIGVCPGTIDTEYNKNKTCPKLNIEQVAEVIRFVITATKNGIEVSEIHLQKVNNEY